MNIIIVIITSLSSTSPTESCHLMSRLTALSIGKNDHEPPRVSFGIGIGIVGVVSVSSLSLTSVSTTPISTTGGPLSASAPRFRDGGGLGIAMRTATRTAGVLPGAPATGAVGDKVDDGSTEPVVDDVATVVVGVGVVMVVASVGAGGDRLLANDRMMNRWSGRDLEGSTAFSVEPTRARPCGDDDGGLTYAA